MYHILTKELIDKFYEDVERLGLEKPVSAITKATGASKGTVSTYLSKKDKPSLNFINKFYDSFGESLKNVPHGTLASSKVDAQPDLMQALVTLMNTQNEILRDQKTELVDRVRRMETNLNAVAGIAESLQYDLVTGRDVVLRSLARIEGLKNEKQLLNEADKMREDQAVAKNELYKSYEVGIKHKVK